LSDRSVCLRMLGTAAWWEGRVARTSCAWWALC